MKPSRPKHLLKIILVGIIIISLFAVIVVNSIISMMKRSFVDDLAIRAEDSSLLVEKQLELYIDQVEAIASRDDIRTMDWATQRKILITEAERIGFERFQVGYVDNTEEHIFGDVISTTGETSNGADRPFFQAAASGISNISDVLFARIDHKMVICVSAPIYNGNKIVGILTGVTDASLLSALVNSISSNSNGYAFIINADGTKMTSPDYSEVENAQNDIICSEGAPAADTHAEIAANPNYDELAAIERKMIAGETGSDTYIFDNEEYYIGYTPLLGGQWFIGVVERADDVMNIPYTMITWLVVIGIGIIFILLLHLKKRESGKTSDTDFSSLLLRQTENEELFSPDSEDTENIMTLLDQMENSLNTLSNICQSTSDIITNIDDSSSNRHSNIEHLRMAAVSIAEQMEKLERAKSDYSELRSKVNLFFKL